MPDVGAASSTEGDSRCRECVTCVAFGQCYHWCGLNIRTGTVAVMFENLILGIIGLFSANLLHIDEFYGTLQVIVGTGGLLAACIIFMCTSESGATGSPQLLKVALVMLFLISVWWVISIMALYSAIRSTRADALDWTLAVYRSLMMLVQSVTIINHMLLAYLVSKAMGAQEALAQLSKGPTESDPLQAPAKSGSVWPPTS